MRQMMVVLCQNLVPHSLATVFAKDRDISKNLTVFTLAKKK